MAKLEGSGRAFDFESDATAEAATADHCRSPLRALRRLRRRDPCAHQRRELLDARVAEAVLAKRLRGAEEIFVSGAVLARRAPDRRDHRFRRQLARIARALAIHSEGQRADVLVADAAVQPLGTVRAEIHLAL